MVYRFMIEHSVEEKIIDRAQKKLYLDAAVVQQGRLQESSKALSKEEVIAIRSFGEHALPSHSAPIIRIPSFGSHHSGPIIRIPSFGSHHSAPIIPLPSFGSHHSGPIIRIPSFGSHPSDPIIRIPS